MSELGPRAREILQSGRGLYRPSAADRVRNESKLRERLGATLLPIESGKATTAVRPRWPFLGSLVVAGVALVGGVVFVASRHQPVIASAPHTVVAALPASASVELPAPLVELPAPDAPQAPVLVASDRPPPSARPAEDRLAQEVALLARATSSLHAGRPADALKVLEEYQRRFPKGLLTEERRAARAQALCALGRQSEAESELSRLPLQSVAAARAKQVCDARSANKP